MLPANHDRHTGIQADTPVPPWERRGAFRLDGEPHRGVLLWVMGTLSLVLSFITAGGCIPVALESRSAFKWTILLPPLLVSFPLSLAARHLARRDLVGIRAGLIDPLGKLPTRRAMDWGLVTFLVACVIEGTLLGLLCTH